MLLFLGITGIGGCVVLLLAVARRRQGGWPRDGHGRTYFSTSSETRMRH